MNVPRMQFQGPLAQRDATALLALAAFMITARAPMGFVLLTLGPLVVIAVQGLRRHTGLGFGPLWLLLGSMVVGSLLSVLLLHPDLLAAPNSFTTALTVLAVAAGALLTGRPRQGADRLLDGMYLGLLFHWAVSMVEALSGLKLLPILYPDANTNVWVTSHRFYVTSLFPNYNDYSVAMVLLVTILLSKALFRNAVHPLVRLGRLLVMATATFEIAYMGSRGALLALAVMGAAVLVTSIQTVRPGTFGARSIVLSAVLVAAAVVGLLNAPWLYDNSNAVRVLIAGRIAEMALANPLEGLFGWGSYSSYQAAAKSAFGGALMDPHNAMLEVGIWFGLPSLLLYMACWWHVVRDGLLRRQAGHDWRAVSLMVCVACYPLLGVVPSSTLRYYLVWVFLVAALGRLAVARREASGSGTAAQEPSNTVTGANDRAIAPERPAALRGRV